GVSVYSQKNAKWTDLFNGKDLKGWKTYLTQELDSAGNKVSDTLIGYNNDPQNIFTVDKKNKMIRISGQSWGAMSTVAEYENYHLQLKFKWGKLKWASKKKSPLDSGLLYHSFGEPVNSGWMTSQEFQVEENNCGDYWIIGKVRVTVPSTKDKPNRYSYDPNGERRDYGVNGNNWCHRGEATEKPAGEWNTLDLYCYGDTSVHVVNGKVVMVLYNSRQYTSGSDTPLTKGKIQLQSEGGEVFYKDIRIQSISGLRDILKH
ncbi:MAG: DUF1080 domain-containing protein, partial [Chitinophagaceae bacterium]|nr:DUF1080 domain-containing protein [Chitinophagaceae bacterium]